MLRRWKRLLHTLSFRYIYAVIHLYILSNMDQFEDKISAWIRSGLSVDGKMEMATYGNSLLMARLAGTDFRLKENWLPNRWHVFLHVYEGELRLTVNADRLGFDAPVYVDFLSRFAWSDVTLAGRYRACIIVAEQEFFIEATQSIRTKVTDGVMYFSQSPFTSLKENEAIRLQQLEDVIFGTLREENNVFTRELLQTMACAWQYELWNVFFHHHQTVRTEGKVHWNDIVSHFFYLAHTHCREHHEVGWYAAQTGVSPDTLSAALKRLFGKTAGIILNELLVNEAKVCLNNQAFSVQEVAEMLGFADQSAFGKFFKRQCGMSPSEFRKQENTAG